MSNITRSAFDRQYAHIGNVRHGVQTGPWRVEFDAEVDATNGRNIKQGSIVSLNNDGKYILGSGTVAEGVCPVPCVSMKNVTDPDVTTGIAGANIAEATYSAIGDVITAIPCTSGYELETTEFVSNETYKPGTLLTADENGKVTPGTLGSDVILGVVSKAPAADYFGNQRIAFFACFVPVAPADGSTL